MRSCFLNPKSHIADSPLRPPGVVDTLSTPVSEGPVVGLIIEPQPGNMCPCLFPPGPTGNQRAGNTN